MASKKNAPDREEKASKDDFIIPPPVPTTALPNLTLPQPEHQIRDIREYVESQASDETVIHLEKIKSENILDKDYDVWDVHTNKSRWWVITSPTNLYSQKHFPSMDYTLSFHVGLTMRMAADQKSGIPEQRERVAQAWRRLDQAEDALKNASEAEDYHAVGVRCREALLALGKELFNSDIVPKGETMPKTGDFVQWTELMANFVYPGASNKEKRSFLKNIAKSTWQLVNWLTHAQKINGYDGSIALGATGTVMGMFTDVLMRKESQLPDECPKCKSYNIAFSYRPDLRIEGDYIKLCEKCDWTDPEGIYSLD